MCKSIVIIHILITIAEVLSFWDSASTTVRGIRDDVTPRQSFFRWQWNMFPTLQFWFWWYDWVEITRRRRLSVIAGISIDFLPLTTAAILNRRTLITSYNPFDPYMDRQSEMRIWAMGRSGHHNAPYRYRLYRITRFYPVSLNPEHCHGPRCTHQPRHDVTIIHSLDQMYLYPFEPDRFNYAYRTFVPLEKYYVIPDDVDLWFAGSGYEYLEHIQQNYKIFYGLSHKEHIVDCSIYIPKWWGKFICVRNVYNFSGVQNGGAMIAGKTIVGIGCFEIRINEDRILCFTDLRYYFDAIRHYAHITPGQYYEYAYPQWSIIVSWFYDGHVNTPYVPQYMKLYDLYPLG